VQGVGDPDGGVAAPHSDEGSAGPWSAQYEALPEHQYDKAADSDQQASQSYQPSHTEGYTGQYQPTEAYPDQPAVDAKPQFEYGGAYEYGPAVGTEAPAAAAASPWEGDHGFDWNATSPDGTSPDALTPVDNGMLTGMMGQLRAGKDALRAFGTAAMGCAPMERR